MAAMTFFQRDHRHSKYDFASELVEYTMVATVCGHLGRVGWPKRYSRAKMMRRLERLARLLERCHDAESRRCWKRVREARLMIPLPDTCYA